MDSLVKSGVADDSADTPLGHQGRRPARHERLAYSGLGFAALVEIGFARLAPAVVVGALGAVALGYTLDRTPAVYEARNLLLVQMGRDYVFVPDTAMNGTRAPDPGDLVPFINAEMQMIDGAEVRNALLDALLADGIVKITPETDRAALYHKLGKAISVQLVTGSYVIDVRVQDDDPATSVEIAKRLVDVFLARRGKMIGSDSPEFIAAEMDRSHSRIAAIDREAQTLGVPVLALPDTVRTASQSGLDKIAQDTDALVVAIAGLQARIAGLGNILANLPNTGATADRARAALVDAKADLADATARQAELEQTRAARLAEAAKIAGTANRLADLARARAAETAWFDQLAQRLNDARLNAERSDRGMGSVRVLEKATPSDGPIGLPDRIKMLASAIFGLILAAVYMVIAELRVLPIHSATIARARIGLPVLGEVEDRARAKKRLGL